MIGPPPHDRARPAAVFLDRDGVINARIVGGYVLAVEQFRLLPGVLDAFRRLAEAALPAVVVTNQSCVGRGLLSNDGLERIHRQLRAEVTAHGGALTRIEVCPHRPEDGCACRKPRPGLLERAAAAIGVSPARVAMVGDAASDLEAAAAAGCGWFYWVGCPAALPALPDTRAGDPAVVAVTSLWDAVCRITAPGQSL